jgi:hypothetical protein
VPVAPPLETTTQAVAVLDAQFAWLRGAEKPGRQRKALKEAFFLAPPPKPPERESELKAELGEERMLRQQGDRFQVDDIQPFLRELGWAGD